MNGDPGDVLAIGSVFAFYLVGIGATLFSLVSLWRVLEKGGLPGWHALVPVYGAIQLLRLVGRPAWWVLLLLLPVVQLVAFALVCLALASSFGRSGGFAIGLILLPFVFLAILAFGSDRFLPPGVEPEHQKLLSNP